MNLREYGKLEGDIIIKRWLSAFIISLFIFVAVFFLCRLFINNFFLSDLVRIAIALLVSIIFYFILKHFLIIRSGLLKGDGLSILGTSKIWRYVSRDYCICPHCFKSIFLNSTAANRWTCSNCNSEKGILNVLAKCRACNSYQNIFACPICGKLIDIEAEYDHNKLERLRRERQTAIIQQENKN